MESRDSVEIISLDKENPHLVCEDLPNLPVGVLQATGQLFNAITPIICGGSKNFSSCQFFQKGVWNFTTNLEEKRRFLSASAILKNLEEKEVFFIAGGSHENNVLANIILNSTETFDGVYWDNSFTESLPLSLSGHCIAKINDTTILAIGGSDKISAGSDRIFDGLNILNNSFFYNAVTNKWTEGPSLNTSRRQLSCGILKWKNRKSGNLDKIVVAAGVNFIKVLRAPFLY
jgi:hypothetical protein